MHSRCDHSFPHCRTLSSPQRRYRSGEPHTPTRRRQQGKDGESAVSEATKELFRLIVVSATQTPLTILLCANFLHKI